MYGLIGNVLGKTKLKCIFEIGTQDGRLTRDLDILFKPKKIYSSEPEKNNYNTAKKDLNKFKNIRLFNYAIGENNQDVVLSRYDHTGTHSLYALAELGSKWFDYPVTKIGSQNANMITLDDFVKKNRPSLHGHSRK